MINDVIKERLFELRDIEYGEFQKKLIPTVNPDTVIGVRLPEIKKLAKELYKNEDIGDFLNTLPHKYYDENQLHAFLISLEKDFGKAVYEVENFLPYVDNWAVCDSLSPKAFKKHKIELLTYIRFWIESGETYAVRFGVKMLMSLYLDDDFSPEYPEIVATLRSEESYVNMMIAWYFATALAKQYDSVISYIENRLLDTWTHNKAIQKCVESRRITPEQKEYLKTLKVKNK